MWRSGSTHNGGDSECHWPDGHLRVLTVSQLNGTSWILSSRLLELNDHTFDAASLSPSFYEALVVIHKSWKPMDQCGSYRLISARIFYNILASKLINEVGVCDFIIGMHRSGFMPEKSIGVNLHRLYSKLQTHHDNRGHRVIAALDNEKAIDSIEWSFMFAVLARMGFPQNFLKWLHLIYRKPTARVRVNGYISDPFPLERVTRQVCPLSPL